MNFVNDFPFLNVPRQLNLTRVMPVFLDSVQGNIQDDIILYRFTATVARTISTITNPVASKGSLLISKQPLDLKDVQVNFFTSFGVFKDVNLEVKENQTIDQEALEFPECIILFLNRKLDEYFHEEGFLQDGRFYWRPDETSPYGRYAEQRIGVFARTQLLVGNNYAARIDYRTHIVGRQTVWDIIQEEMRRAEISEWKELNPNKLELLGGIYRLFRTTYVDFFRDEPIFRTFYFNELKITRSVSDPDDKGHIPLKYQEERGRTVDPVNQPVILCRDRRSRPEYDPVSCIPSLLVPIIRLDDLKRITPRFSVSAQEEAQPDIRTRYQETIDITEFLIDKGVLGYPKEIITTDLGPVTLRVSPDREVSISEDEEFRQIFSVNRLSIKPNWERMVVIYDQQFEEIANEFIKHFRHQFSLFKLSTAITPMAFSSNLKITGDPFVRDFSDYITNTGKTLKPETDLLLVIRPSKCKKRMKFPIKRELTVGKKLATQFVNTDTIIKLRDDLKKQLINPLFMQLVLKMGGSVATYKVHSDLKNAIIIGIDRHRSQGRISVNASAVALAADGRFLSSFVPTLDSWTDDSLGNLDPIVRPLLDDIIVSKYDFNHVILLREGGPSSFPYIQQEKEQFNDILSSYDLVGSFLTANKSSGIRIFEGIPTDDESILKPPQYTGIYQYPRNDCFIVTTTQTIRPTRGTPKPMQYQIHSGQIEPEFQLALMQTLAGLSRVGTLSSRSTRLPMPLHYAHTFAKFVADVENVWTEPIKRPLYL